MTWFQVDDHLSDHRKVRKLGDDRLLAVGLWTLCGSWCGANLSDGFIPAEVVDRYDPGLKIAARLVEVELWSDDDLDGEPGFRFHEWSEYQLSKDEVLQRRADNRDRQRRYRERQRGDSGIFSEDADVEDCSNTLLPLNSHEYSNITRYDTECIDQIEETAGQPSHNALLLSNDVTPPYPFPSLPTKQTTSTSKAAKEEDSFTEFWTAYPRKQQKQDARKAWTQQRRLGVTPERLIAGAKGYAEYHQERGTSREYIKLPGGWLRAGGFEDHQPTQPPQPDVREPVEVLRGYWQEADAKAVARILRVPFADEGQPPSDTTPHDEWLLTTRKAWINDHYQDAVQVLENQATRRRNGFD